MKNNHLKQFSTLLLIGIFLFLAYGSDNGSESDKISIEGKFEDDRVLKDYLISRGEMKIDCSIYGYTAKIKFLDHSKAEFSWLGEEIPHNDKYTTEYTIGNYEFWKSRGMNKEFRRAVRLKDGGVLGKFPIVQFVCFSKDPHAEYPSFEGQDVYLQDGCTGIGL
jgi:hypothetical protein